MDLKTLGFDKEYIHHFEPYIAEGYSAARVSLEHKNLYIIITEQGEMQAEPTGKMYYDADENGLPVVGDWVAVRILDEQPPRAIINSILPRKSKFSRKAAGNKTVEQPIAANIDTVFIVVGLDHNFSTRRIERYLTLAWESRANPVVILTKADLCESLDERLAEVESVAPGVPVHAVSVLHQSGLAQFDSYLKEGKTIALLGSSGVGKSTIINYLLGKETQRVQEVRDDDSKGRHTTTHRQLFVLNSGALVIDTPGMRELQLWNAESGLSETFNEIEELARGCQFADCTHQNEPGCKVLAALESGELDSGRFDNYQRMQKELQYLEQKQNSSSAQIERAKWKTIHKSKRDLDINR